MDSSPPSLDSLVRMNVPLLGGGRIVLHPERRGKNACLYWKAYCSLLPKKKQYFGSGPLTMDMILTFISKHDLPPLDGTVVCVFLISELVPSLEGKKEVVS